jgi:hypothetical protein
LSRRRYASERAMGVFGRRLVLGRRGSATIFAMSRLA